MADSTNDLASKLDAIAADIAAGRIGRSEPWGGADVLITSTLPEHKNGPGFDRNDQVVVTHYVGELSWLFESLRDAFCELIDYRSKYEFYGRLADAAERYAGAESVGEMLTGVLDEARVMARELGDSDRGAK